MSDGMFHLVGEHLVPIGVRPYETEEALQVLIERYPDLLAGGQMSPGQPRRWVLVKREHGVPDSDVSAGRWNVDHLFVDQDAVPTLVEVKRSTDTRIRREVVGQMLDYAANGVRYWPASGLQAAFEATQSANYQDPVQAIGDLLGDPNQTVEDFFAQVETNLRAGRLRLVFVADIIPDELLRIVEFLNEQMSQAEVFAVEIRRYGSDAEQDFVIVPRLLGRTGAAVAKSSRKGPRSTHDEAVSRSGEDTRSLASRVEEFAQASGLIIEESPTALSLKTAAREPLAVIYFGYNSLDVPLQPLRDRGWNEAADRAFNALRATTPKELTQKVPAVPASDALVHWEEIRDVLSDIARLLRTATDAQEPTHSPTDDLQGGGVYPRPTDLA